MNLRVVVVLAAAFVVLAAPRPASAWQEAHESGDDVRVHMAPDGTAAIEDLVRWRVVHGPLKSIDIVNVDPIAGLDPDVTITAEDGRALTGHLVRADERTVRVLIDQPRAFLRGTFTFNVKWKLNFAAAHALVFDGTSWRLSWSAPVASDGIDASRTVFDLPAAPEEPRAIMADTGAPDDGAVSSVQRDGARDALELVRPHVARGESASWTVRIDPRALTTLTDPALRPVRMAAQPEQDRVHAIALALLLGVLALGFALLVGRKTAAFEALCAARDARARGLLPLPATARAVLAGGAFGAAAACEIADRPLAGVSLAALAAIAAALRAPAARSKARGPGKWLALRPDDAFAPPTGSLHWMDAGGAPGRVAMAGLVIVTCAFAAAARRWTPEGPWIVSLHSAALLPLFLTGRAVQLPPAALGHGASWLRRTFARLAQLQPLRTVPWARVLLDGATIDEVRLLVLPRAAMPGVAGIEVGIGWIDTPVGWVGSPEVLVRVLDGSPAAARLAQAGAPGRTLPGRRTDERVLRAVPRVRTPAGATALVGAFAEVMTDRRLAIGPGAWTAPERRMAGSGKDPSAPGSSRAPVAA
jgi:hypothetical protein